MQDSGQRRIYQIPCRRLQMLIYDFFAPHFSLPYRCSSQFRFAFRLFPRFFSFLRSSPNAFPALRAPGRDAIPEKKVWRNTRARAFPFIRSAIDRVLRKSWNRDLRASLSLPRVVLFGLFVRSSSSRFADWSDRRARFVTSTPFRRPEETRMLGESLEGRAKRATMLVRRGGEETTTTTTKRDEAMGNGARVLRGS